MMPEHAVKAYTELDGSILNGRMLHILPGKSKITPEDLLQNGRFSIINLEKKNYLLFIKQKKRKLSTIQKKLKLNLKIYSKIVDFELVKKLFVSKLKKILVSEKKIVYLLACLALID